LERAQAPRVFFAKWAVLEHIQLSRPVDSERGEKSGRTDRRRSRFPSTTNKASRPPALRSSQTPASHSTLNRRACPIRLLQKHRGGRIPECVRPLAIQQARAEIASRLANTRNYALGDAKSRTHAPESRGNICRGGRADFVYVACGKLCRGKKIENSAFVSTPNYFADRRRRAWGRMGQKQLNRVLYHSGRANVNAVSTLAGNVIRAQASDKCGDTPAGRVSARWWRNVSYAC